MSIKGLFPIDKWDFGSGSILADLPVEDLEILNAHKSEHFCKRGEIIFREGAYSVGIYYILSGKIKKYKVDKDGKEQIIYIANTGELVGYHAIIAEEPYPDYAAALEDSRIAFIPRDDFLNALNHSTILNRRLLKAFSREYGVLANSITLFAQRSVRERLALQLVVVREKYKVNFKPGSPVEIDLSRDDLAGLVGTARENVVRNLSDFKEEGIIRTKGRKIFVLDVRKLIEIANYR